MRTPTPSESAWSEKLTACFKPEILAMPGYVPPPGHAAQVKLNQNESPDEPGSTGEGLRWNRYPAYRHSALIEKLAARYGGSADSIMLGNGSNSLLYLVGSALLERGDTVLLSPPTFSLYNTVAQINQADVIHVPRLAEFAYDVDALCEAARRAKLVMLASPDNPTGAMLANDELARLLKACPGFVLCDAAYDEFNTQTALPLLKGHPNLLLLKTFSKALALGGARLGWLMARPEAVHELSKAAVPYAVNTQTARKAEWALDNWPTVQRRIDRIVAERKRMQQALTGLGITVFPGPTNFLLCRFDDAEAVRQGLAEQSIQVRDMQSTPGLVQCLRITVGSVEENDRLLAALSAMQNEEKSP